MEHKRFTHTDMGISGVAPDGWVEAQPGIWLRHACETDPTHLVQQRVGGLSRDDVMALAVSEEGLDELPRHAGMIESSSLSWDWYRGQASEPAPRAVVLALAQRENWVYVVVLVTTPGEMDDLHSAAFLPAVQALAPAALDAEVARQLEAHAKEHRQMIRANRDALRNGPWPDFPTQSDQERGLPIPPPQQPYDASAPTIDLPAPDPTVLTKALLGIFFSTPIFLVVLTVLVWRKRYWSILERVQYTTIVLGALVGVYLLRDLWGLMFWG